MREKNGPIHFVSSVIYDTQKSYAFHEDGNNLFIYPSIYFAFLNNKSLSNLVSKQCGVYDSGSEKRPHQLTIAS